MDNAEKICSLIDKAQKIVILTGAGISTSCGIPDFRGPTGIYSYVGKKYNLPYPEAVFDIDYFYRDPQPFFDFSKELFINKPQPSFAHKFIAALENKANKLNMLVTQNIDMLHELAGNKKMIACHGTYHTAHCTKCGKKYSLNQYETKLKNGEIINCECGSIVKPDIVFFGESLPASFIDFLDNPTPTDLVMTIGTSLTVQPACLLPMAVKQKYDVPMVLINKDSTPYDKAFDHIINDDIDETFKKINKNVKLI